MSLFIYILACTHVENRGHTAALTLARWHPTDKSSFLTAAADSTIRLWSAEDTKKQRGVIPVKSKVPGGRTPITAAAYSNDGRLIVGGMPVHSRTMKGILLTQCIYAGGEDGALRVWAARGPYVMPSLVSLSCLQTMWHRKTHKDM